MVAQEKLRDKEVADTKKYLKKIWGKDIPLKKMSYKELKELGEDLGMNIFNIKSFHSGYNNPQRRFKSYTRICKYCKIYYDVKVKMKVRPKGAGVCPRCKKKSYSDRFNKRKIKNKIKWERLILDVLKNNERLSILEIAEKLGCSGYPVRKTLKDLSKKGKINLLKNTTAKIN